MNTHDELMATLRANPSDEGLWAVLTDWLLAAEDPRGALAAAETDEPAMANLLARLAPTWLDHPVRVEGRKVTIRKNLDDTYSPGVTLTFARGHVRTLQVETCWDGDRDGWDQDLLYPVLTRLLAHPVGQLIQEIELRATPNSDFLYEGLVETLTAAGPLAVRTWYCGDNDQLSWTHVPDCRTLWGAAPWLQSAKLEGSSIRLGTLRHDRLQRLHLISGGLPTEPVAALVDADVPALRDLEIWFGSSGYGAECGIDDVLPLLGRSFPSLRRMGLCNCEFGDTLALALPKAVWLPQLEELSLYGCILTDSGGMALLANADALRTLQRLDLGRCYLSPAMVSRLTDAFGSRLDAGTGHNGQKAPYEFGGRRHFYVAVGE